VTQRVDGQISKMLGWTVFDGKAGNCLAVHTASRLTEHTDIHQDTFQNINMEGKANFKDKGSVFPAVVFKLVSRFID
jgi:cytochrome c peroxidase